MPSNDRHNGQDGERGLVHSFWQELQNRRVFRAAVAYIIIAWALLQVIDIIFPLLGVPPWGMTVTFLGLLVGFPLVIMLAWIFQWSADGLRYESPFKATEPRGFRRMSLGVALLATGMFSLLFVQSWQQLDLEQTVSEGDSAPVEDSGGIPGNSIAVLRFANIGGAPEDDYFSDGLSEELLNVLARLREIKVVSRTSSWSLPQDVDIATIRERLRVGYVLEGSVRRNGDVVRITAQLINTGSGYHLWSDTFDRKIEDLLKVQDEVARQITDALQILLSERSKAYLEQSRINNVDAYEAYLQGLAALRKPLKLAVLDEAEAFFLQANKLEPGFSGSWAGLCKTRLKRYGFSRSVADFEQAEAACHRTLTLDESSSDVFEALGELYMKSGQLDKAERNYRSALVLAPNSAEAMMGLGTSLARQGKRDEAKSYLQRAVALDAGYWKAQNALGGFYFAQGQADRALPYFRRVTQLAPDYVIGHNNLGAAIMLTGDFDQAVRAFDAALALGPDRYAYANAGSAQFFLRKFDIAAQMYQRAISLTPEDYNLWGNLGDALGHLGRDEEARDAYKRAVELAEGLRDIDADDTNLQVSLARYYARLGRKDDARSVLDGLDLTAADMYVYYDMALAFVAIGNRQASLDALRHALEAGYAANLIRQDAGLDELRSEPGYIELMDRDRQEK